MYLKTSNQEKLDLGVGNYSCNWGVHIAGLYETEEERDEIINGYLAEGAEVGDLQLYCPTEQTEAEFKEKITQECPHCKELVNDPNCFSISSTKELYYPDGMFSPIAMDVGLNNFYAESQKKGKRSGKIVQE